MYHGEFVDCIEIGPGNCGDSKQTVTKAFDFHSRSLQRASSLDLHIEESIEHDQTKMT